MELHHKLKPLHNWRDFLKEVGVIVLGVLIALGGEQAVEAIHHRSEVKEVREALREEIAWDLASLKSTPDLSRCAFARLDEIELWQKSWEDGKPIQLLRPIPVPGYMVFRTSVWRVTAGDAVSRMPLDERDDYGGFYDGTEANARIREDVAHAWADLRLLQTARRLSDDQLLQVTKDIQTIRSLTQILSENFVALRGITAKHGISPGRLPVIASVQQSWIDECKPLLAS